MLCCWDIPDSTPALVSSGVASGGIHKFICSCLCATCVYLHARVPQHTLVMHNVCEALLANSYLSHPLDTDSLFGGGAKPPPSFFCLRHEVRLANLLNLSI